MDGKQRDGCKPEGNLICTQFNLDISKLEQESLLSNPTYRRLYNIVKNDMTRTDLSFRKHLIKELYFLLQIAPIMDRALRDTFLAEVQKMYNLNDHKKIHLASNKLNRLLNIVHNQKQVDNAAKPQRPRTGVEWNQNVSPFLRPYTATRRREVGRKDAKRPQSSKFGPSTKADSVEQFCIKEFTTNIKEQLQISQDFLQKRRTNHPEYEPIYQQLYNILKKVEGKRPEEKEQKVLRNACRYPKSAFVRHPTVNWVTQDKDQQEVMPDQQPVQSESSQKKIIVKDNQSDEEQSSEEEYLYVKDENKTNRLIQKAVDLQEMTEKQGICDQKLRKYHHLLDNKLVQAMKDDKETAQRYVNYARVKSAMKRQLNRRTQSRRLMSAKPNSKSTVKMHQIALESEKENDVSRVSYIDLTKDPLACPQENLQNFPTYDKRQLLKDLYERPLKQFEKRNNIGYCLSPSQKKNPNQRPITSYTRFHSPVRFDPFSRDNVIKYNAQALDEIEKIKSKIGGGKCYASTESLMKALVVLQGPEQCDMPKWEDKNPAYGMVGLGPGKKLKKRGGKILKSSKSIKNIKRK